MMGTELEVDVISDGKDVLIPVLWNILKGQESIAVIPSPYILHTTLMILC
jgi:hypothetical protein